MKVNAITFSAAAEPVSLTVEMSVDEAALLSVVLGGMTGTEKNAIMRGGTVVGTEIWDCLQGMVFNRYYDGGYNEYLRQRS